MGRWCHWTVAHGGKWYQLDRQHEALSLAGRQVVVRRLRDGRVELERGGVKLKWRELAGRPVRAKVKPAAAAKRAAAEKKPAANHPWRMQRIGSVREAMKRRAGGARRVVGENNNRPRGHYLPSS